LADGLPRPLVLTKARPSAAVIAGADKFLIELYGYVPGCHYHGHLTALQQTRGLSGARMSGDQGLILASLNTHGGRGADGLAYDLEAACRQLKADVIVLQEVWHAEGEPDPADEIASVLGAGAIHADMHTDTDLRSLGVAAETTRGRWGLAVLTRLLVAGYEVADLGRTPGDPTPRVAQLVTLDIPRCGRLRVVNAHLTYLLASPVQLMRLVLRLAGDDVPTVIAGDLNMPLPVTGLAAGYDPAVIGRTYPAVRPLVQLDHILAGRWVTRCGGEVLGPVGSDHLPVRARLRLSPA
jgi:endonuclease/exonuclease/phosphatase family metal-dependent hydrolase